MELLEVPACICCQYAGFCGFGNKCERTRAVKLLAVPACDCGDYAGLYFFVLCWLLCFWQQV